MKHLYFESLTPWSNENQTGRGYIVWYKRGGHKRGELAFKLFDSIELAREFAGTLEK